MKRLRFRDQGLDDVDVRILEHLVDNARKPVAEIARAVGMSAPSVAERVKRMEEAGVISGYRATLGAEAAGLPLTVWLRIRPVPGSLQTVAELLREIPEIVECDRVTGEDCFLARAHLRSVQDLEQMIDRINPHALTNTSVVQSSPVAPRLPPLPVESRG